MLPAGRRAVQRRDSSRVSWRLVRISHIMMHPLYERSPTQRGTRIMESNDQDDALSQTTSIDDLVAQHKLADATRLAVKIRDVPTFYTRDNGWTSNEDGIARYLNSIVERGESIENAFRIAAEQYGERHVVIFDDTERAESSRETSGSSSSASALTSDNGSMQARATPRQDDGLPIGTNVGAGAATSAASDRPIDDADANA